jgi:hypothetical protein
LRGRPTRTGGRPRSRAAGTGARLRGGTRACGRRRRRGGGGCGRTAGTGGSAPSRRKWAGLDEAGECLDEQLLPAGEAVDAGDTRATRRDSRARGTGGCARRPGRPRRARRRPSFGRRVARGREDGRVRSPLVEGREARVARAARSAADKALGTVGGGVEGGRAGVYDGAKLRDRRAQAPARGCRNERATARRDASSRESTATRRGWMR